MFEFKLKKIINQALAIDVNFKANAGEITVLIGKSGAGKSTILDIIAGLAMLDAGFIKNEVADYTKMPTHLRKFGYVKQQSLLFPHLSVYENIMYGQKEDQLTFAKYVEVFELTAKLSQKVEELSGGEARRVAIVRTLMSKPQLLLLDEVFSSLDPFLRTKVRNFLKTQLRIPVIMVTHDMHEASEMADQLIKIEAGKIALPDDFEKVAPSLSVAILAGGAGLRFGGVEKAFLTYQGRTFIERILAEVADFDEVLISVCDKLPYAKLGYPLIVDETFRIGPLGGIYTALKACQHDYLFVWAADMPLLKKELILFIMTFISSDYEAIVVQTNDKVHPLCAIYHKSLLPVIKQQIVAENYQLLALLRLVKTKYVPLSYSCFPDQTVVNINEPADLQALNSPAVFCVSGVKNSGKTTLVAKLVAIFKEQGYFVGTIKHDGHDFEIDYRGTDTYQYRQAGSDTTLIYSAKHLALMKKQADVKIAELLTFFSDMDIVIVEGLKNAPLPKIETVLTESICNPQNLLAVVTAGSYKHEQVPTFKPEAARHLVELVKKEVMFHGR